MRITGYGGSGGTRLQKGNGTPPPPLQGPGTEYEIMATELSKALGVKLGCSPCTAAKAEMNILGVEGCKRDRERLIPMLKKLAAKNGIVWPADAPGPHPVETMLDEAIRLAEEKAEKSLSHQGR